MKWSTLLIVLVLTPTARAEGWPIVQAKCLGCHGDDAKKLRGGLDLRTRDGALKGGDSGKPALVPGQPDKSPLYLAVTRKHDALVMPPKESDRLDDRQVEAIHRWIRDGAPWGAKPEARAEGRSTVRIATSGGRSREWDERGYKAEDLWAYQPLSRHTVPKIGNPDAHPVDAFLQSKQREKGVERTAPPADRRTLIRRVTFDLTGLPPTPDEVEAFVRGDKEAYGKLVTRLLASTHYGEQQARHWLDVVRYADTSGFANDFERPHAWRYRDWVVRAFNADKPYDRFVREQVAGDELDPDNPEMHLATGFLCMGPWEHTGMSVAALTRQQYLDDVTHAVGVTFLAQGLRCASCHDHKFDPVPTKDYYRLQAVFAPVQFAERATPFLDVENTRGFAAEKGIVAARLRKAEVEIERLRQKSEDAIAATLKARGVKRLIDIPEAERPKRQFHGLTADERSVLRILQKRAEYYNRELLRFEPYSFTVYSGPERVYLSIRATHPLPASRKGAVPSVRILPGGSLETPAEPVTPGVLSALPGSNEASQKTAWNTIPETMDGRRLALANWLTSAENPLTARVIVNRVWQQHFGTGLVATAGSFGKMGAKPTHPELLDWLAVWFVEHGWSVKQLHRLILTSAAYQQAGAHAEMEKVGNVDPKNALLSYYPPRRLAAEELRDAMLAVSGELNREAGGPGGFPEINWEIARQPRHIMGSVAPAYVPSMTPGQRNRRTIYTFRYRTLADPFLEVFNRPGSETACDCREATTVAPQALTLFNSAFAHDRARALAIALRKASGSVEENVTRAFEVVYGRAATMAERQRCVAHVRKMTAVHEANPPARVGLPGSVKRKMVEEMTGEEYEWEEELELKGYRRDAQAWEVDATTRALAEVCLVLFNSNEFVHVR